MQTIVHLVYLLSFENTGQFEREFLNLNKIISFVNVITKKM